MKNLEQIRAANALDYARSGENTRGQEGGNVLKKLPALIMNNGILAAGAFGYAQNENSGWKSCFNNIAKHLAHKEIAIVPEDKSDLEKLMDYLSNSADSNTLKLATEEALAWLSYARRFEKSQNNGGDHDTDE
ncbi:type III-B CRISPR module-associated protein Cmr5 [Fontisphaera persica]|uniref:type III-B CRISPR module-associated protein Cmr5 n=1 Tax=Fontisphaera persica TaxID=2974023 RepID=UPI0024C03542|nr:type III-B CRISPR module-associated protein Cmr5 [Fontisphaera persica]WCJ60671.1 type III-B CRISPR module-associated protein Cmr5 [Fontisphaera persica]